LLPRLQNAGALKTEILDFKRKVPRQESQLFRQGWSPRRSRFVRSYCVMDGDIGPVTWREELQV
jgi:hypothetical protein